jgi:hypothetical protein
LCLGLFDNLFKSLFDLDIIQKESFIEWKKENEVGKKESISQLGKWFQSF